MFRMFSFHWVRTYLEQAAEEEVENTGGKRREERASRQQGLSPSSHQKPLQGVLPHRWLGPLPQFSFWRSGLKPETAFLTSSQRMLKLLLGRTIL